MKDYEALSRKHFDRQAAEYDQRDTVYYSQNGKISCRDIVQQIKSVPYEALLDVGCGTGFLIELLAGQRDTRYCGLDLSDEIKACCVLLNKQLMCRRTLDQCMDCSIPFEAVGKERTAK